MMKTVFINDINVHKQGLSNESPCLFNDLLYNPSYQFLNTLNVFATPALETCNR